MLRNSVLIIPSLNPDERLISYVEDFISNGFTKIILVNDGSNPKAGLLFDTICSRPECDLLVHTVNMGKGRSLKDAFNYYCQKYFLKSKIQMLLTDFLQHEAKTHHYHYYAFVYLR